MTIINKLMYKTLLSLGFFVEKNFTKQTKNPLATNANILFKILNKNKNTEIGQKYNFKKIKSIDDF
ncbi:GH3 auxin-responsive promoter [Clostridium sp. DSM 8431]|nr:GH3 auxin-responsive promoter [Clostridium sp. DSM 8431]